MCRTTNRLRVSSVLWVWSLDLSPLTHLCLLLFISQPDQLFLNRLDYPYWLSNQIYPFYCYHKAGTVTDTAYQRWRCLTFLPIIFIKVYIGPVARPVNDWVINDEGDKIVLICSIVPLFCVIPHGGGQQMKRKMWDLFITEGSVVRYRLVYEGLCVADPWDLKEHSSCPCPSLRDQLVHHADLAEYRIVYPSFLPLILKWEDPYMQVHLTRHHTIQSVFWTRPSKERRLRVTL